MSGTQAPFDHDCIFCKIAAGQIPAATVYEDEHLIAFLDINPSTHGHTLVLPRGHYPTIYDLPPDIAAHLGRTLPKLATAVRSATDSAGINIVNNNGTVAGQSVHHVHFHIVPRYEGDPIEWRWPAGSYDDDAQRDRVREAIRHAIG